MSSPPFIQLSLDFNAPHDRFIDSRGTTYIHINSGSGFRRYISSDGYPWTLWLRTLHLEPGCTKLETAPALAMRGKNIKSYLRMAYNSKLCYVHRIVAQFFLNDGKPIPPGMQVDHLDGNIFNNAVSNLEIVTTAENYRRRNEKRGWKRMSAHRRNAAARNARKRRARIHATLTAQRHAAQQNPTA